MLNKLKKADVSKMNIRVRYGLVRNVLDQTGTLVKLKAGWILLTIVVC